MRKIIATECTSGAIRPYVQGVDLGSMVPMSSQIPVCPQTDEVAENMADQAYQSLESVKAIVKSADLKVSNITKATVFVSDLNDFATINQVYQQFSDEHKAIYLTHSRVQVIRLPGDMKLKIEAVAVRGDTL